MTKRRVSSKIFQITLPMPIYEILKESSIQMERPTSQFARELIEMKLMELGLTKKWLQKISSSNK
jgi:hypothetical protein